MEQILYISTARQEPTAAMLRAILASSRANNRRDGLTGLLLVGGRRFLQVLEGPRALVDRAYGRIRIDPRHFALVELGRHIISERSFGGWDMGYEQEDGTTLLEAVGSLMNSVADANLRAELISFAHCHRRNERRLALTSA